MYQLELLKKCTGCSKELCYTEFSINQQRKPFRLAKCKACTYSLYTRPGIIKKLIARGISPKVRLPKEESELRKRQRSSKYQKSDKGKEAKKRHYNKSKANKVPKPPRVLLTKEQKAFNARELARKYREKNKDKIKANRPKSTKAKVPACPIQKKLSRNIRKRFRKALKGNFKSGSSIKSLGCTIAEFKVYIQGLFTNGMSWDNYGDWHIDHIKPLCSVDLTDPIQMGIVCHYTNLRPLWAKDNIAKAREDVKLIHDRKSNT